MYKWMFHGCLEHKEWHQQDIFWVVLNAAAVLLLLRLDLPSGFITTRPLSMMDSFIDDWKRHCLNVSWRREGVTGQIPLKCRLSECNLVVPCNNNVIDFALRGQEMTSKLPPFIPSARLKNSHQQLNLWEGIRPRRSCKETRVKNASEGFFFSFLLPEH